MRASSSSSGGDGQWCVCQVDVEVGISDSIAMGIAFFWPDIAIIYRSFLQDLQVEPKDEKADHTFKIPLSGYGPISRHAHGSRRLVYGVLAEVQSGIDPR